MTNVKLFNNGITKIIEVDDSTFRDDEYFDDIDNYLSDRDYIYNDYEILTDAEVATIRKERVKSLLDAQITLFETQRNLESAMEECGVEVCERTLEVHLFKSIDIVADALGVKPTIKIFSPDFPDKLEYSVTYKGFKFFELRQLKV